jgi:hypothetical protein
MRQDALEELLGISRFRDMFAAVELNEEKSRSRRKATEDRQN